MGLVARRRGTVHVNGQHTSALKPFEIARLGVGFTPEDRRIFSDLTVLENLDVGRQKPRRLYHELPAPVWSPERLFRTYLKIAGCCRSDINAE